MNADFHFGKFKCCQVSSRQIHNVNIVTHSGSVWGVVVISIHRQPVPAPLRDFGDVGNKIIRYTLRLLANTARRMSANRIEIAQIDSRKCGIGAAPILDHLFDNSLGMTIGVGRPKGVILGNGNDFGIAVHRGR